MGTRLSLGCVVLGCVLGSTIAGCNARDGLYEPPTAVVTDPAPIAEHVELGARATAITAHDGLACALLVTGQVSCWGVPERDDAHELPGHMPQPIANLDDVVELSPSCARTRAGDVRCWNREQAVFEPRPAKIDHVAGKPTHSCLISGGSVYCAGWFGGYRFGEVQRDWITHPLARGEARPDPRGAKIVGITNATVIAVGDAADCAIVDGGEIACWGAFINSSTFLPVVRVPGVRDAVDISIEWEHACAVRRTGDVVCWGDANGEHVPVDMKVAVVPHAIAGIHDATHVAVGFGHACAVRRTGQLACWGESYRGARGTGRLDDSDRGCGQDVIGEHWHGFRCFGDPANDRVPTPVAGISDATDVAAGDGFTCALRATGEVTCWGQNDRDQLGIETPSRSPSLVAVVDVDHVTQLVVGLDHTCALRADGNVYCWGASYRRQLDRTESSARPTRITRTHDAVQLAANRDTTCALSRDGTVTCWGGDASKLVVPTQAATQIALGPYGLCALTRSGGVQCNAQTFPAVVNAKQIVSGRDFACARTGSSATCWGPGFKLETYWYAANPDPHVVTKEPVTAIAACGGQLCAATSSGAVCGRSEFGITAVDGYPMACHTPWQRVLDGIDVQEIVHGRDHQCVLLHDGHVMCRGANDFGQLGTGAMGILAAPAMIRTI